MVEASLSFKQQAGFGRQLYLASGFDTSIQCQSQFIDFQYVAFFWLAVLFVG